MCIRDSGETTALTTDGGYAQYTLAYEYGLIKMPDLINSTEGAPLLLSLIHISSNLARILNSFTICVAVFPLLSISRISCQSILLCGRPSFLFKPKSPRLRAIVDASTYRISAVSYTHLDVYKRQVS